MKCTQVSGLTTPGICVPATATVSQDSSNMLSTVHAITVCFCLAIKGGSVTKQTLSAQRAYIEQAGVLCLHGSVRQTCICPFCAFLYLQVDGVLHHQ